MGITSVVSVVKFVCGLPKQRTGAIFYEHQFCIKSYKITRYSISI